MVKRLYRICEASKLNDKMQPVYYTNLEETMKHKLLSRIFQKCRILPLIAFLVMTVILNGTDAQARFRPKEYDLTLVTQFENCSSAPPPQQGLCQGGNWATAFTTALYYNTCSQSFEPMPPLSRGELLKCATTTFDKCANIPPDLSIVTTLKDYMMSSGLQSASCVAYKQTLSPTFSATCPTTCDDGSAKVAGTLLSDLTELSLAVDVQDWLVDFGAIVVAVKDVPSLNEYKDSSSGIYNITANEQTFGVRFLVVVGWSTLASGEVVWKVQNTTGDQPGQTGRISMSSQNTNILKYYGFSVSLF